MSLLIAIIIGFIVGVIASFFVAMFFLVKIMDEIGKEKTGFEIF